MRLILHIGMGKTGTSSIQGILRENTESLLAQKACYLGMWFDLIDPGYRGHEAHAAFCRAAPEVQQANARALADALKDRAVRDGTETFILSNEALFANARNLRPFLDELKVLIDLKLLAYMRDPHQWLPSAFTQWGLRHKQQQGPLQPFAQRARTLIGQYDGIREWITEHGDILVVRRHDRSINVVEDFTAACGLVLSSSERRYLERSEPAETVMRAAFNARFDVPVMPDRFSHVVLNTNKTVPTLESLVELCFSHEGIGEIVSEKRDLFEFIRDHLGEEFDFLADTSDPAALPDSDLLRQRMFDYLLETVIAQSLRLRRLEKIVSELQDDQP